MSTPSLRVGQGFDSHEWAAGEDRELVLAGVAFPGERGLAGHSDADVIAHACLDALLGATGRGDIGTWFPDSDARYAGADSMGLLRDVVATLSESGWRPVNIDCVVVAESPKLAPHRAALEANLTAAVGAPVTVKGKRPEGLPEPTGIACWAVALVAGP